jgi:hypothetical protein
MEAAVDKMLLDLQRLFVEARLTQGRSQQIADNAGIDFHEVSWVHDDALFWATVLQRAHTAWMMEGLFAAADHVFGGNPTWLAAKRDYLTARTHSPQPSSSPSQPSSGADPRVAAVDLALDGRHLEALRDALDLIKPIIFNYREVQLSRLDAACKALLAIDPLIEMLHAAAGRADGTPRRRHDLQQIVELLEKSRKSVSNELIALNGVSSEEAAEKICDDLTKDTAILLAQYRQAIEFRT